VKIKTVPAFSLIRSPSPLSMTLTCSRTATALACHLKIHVVRSGHLEWLGRERTGKQRLEKLVGRQLANDKVVCCVSGSSIFTWQAYNALFIVRNLCKYFVENLTEDVVLEQFRTVAGQGSSENHHRRHHHRRHYRHCRHCRHRRHHHRRHRHQRTPLALCQICGLPVTTLRVNCLRWVSQPGQLGLPSLCGR